MTQPRSCGSTNHRLSESGGFFPHFGLTLKYRQGMTYESERMASSNTRIRGIILELLFEEGPLTIPRLRDRLGSGGQTRNVPSQQRLASILTRTKQIQPIGTVKVSGDNGKENHTLYDINRQVIRDYGDIVLTTSTSHLPPSLKSQVERCPGCGLLRLMPEGESNCLFCLRISEDS